MKHKLTTFAAAAIAIASGCSCSCGDKGEFDYLYENLPFDMPKVSRPDIPDYSVNLTDFGGVGDGVALNTEAFKAANVGRVVYYRGLVEFSNHVG